MNLNLLLILFNFLFTLFCTRIDVKYEIAKSSNEFGFNIFNKMKSGSDNLVFSPYSIFAAMSMALAGANSTTRDQIKDVLKIKIYDDDTVIHPSIKRLNDDLDITNVTKVAQAIFLKDGANPKQPFMDILTNYYDSHVEPVAFEYPGRTIINDWIGNKTQGLIKDMIPENVLSKDTYSVLVNTIHFKHTWLDQFKVEDTKSHQFALINENELSGSGVVQMMHHSLKGTYGSGINFGGSVFDYLELLYGNENETESNYKMTLVLPRFNTLSSFNSLENEIVKRGREFFDLLYQNRKYGEVKVKLPKFKIEFAKSLVEPFKDLDLDAPFNPVLADFSKITEDVQLVIGEILHNAKAIIDEKGTEAAAATVIVMNELTSLPGIKPQPFEFYCHRPFLFFLTKTKTNLILFQGRVFDPEVSTDPIEVKISDYYSFQYFWKNFEGVIFITGIIGILICLLAIVGVIGLIIFIIVSKSTSKDKKEGGEGKELIDEESKIDITVDE